MKRNKCLLLSTIALGTILCLVSCGDDDPGVIRNSTENSLPLMATIWNEDMSEKIHEVSSLIEDKGFGRQASEETIELSLNSTYVLELYIYYESSDPAYNYTDVTISYNDITLNYDSSVVETSMVEQHQKYKSATSRCYYFSGLCETEQTNVEAYVPAGRVEQKKEGMEFEFFTTFNLAFN